ncbi:type I restriction modification enzyme protein S [Micromonospora fulviviridis]|uniref:restriction endonuclease subunit S n=1 Tax=Micromonospora fulviviridis TaxID=47860 RepID=UPI00166BD8BB|nr:restriction endonuclease subunit S [Micromonospora fulviviridis]GGS00484.1 type I restriction modification enzyme protein S [Micromonospora fulviviridis]
MSAWPKARLSDCCEIVSGATPKTGVEEYWDGEIPWATPKDLSVLRGTYIHDTPRKITAAGLRSCAASVLPAGSVLLSSRAPIGHVAINTIPMATNQGFKSLVPDARAVEAKYLYWWLKGNRSYLEGLGNGATFKEISKAVVAQVEIPLPPLEEQRRIAEVLNRADEVRTKRREALAHLDDLTQSIFLDMFATEASNAWPTVTVADVADQRKGSIRTGPFGSQLLHSEFVDHGVAVLGIDNAVSNEFRWDERRFISEEKYQQLARYAVHPGDVLITIMGTCGRCAVVPDDIPRAINTKHLCCITLDAGRCMPAFLHRYFLTHPAARRYLQQTAKGAIMAGLNMEIIKALPVVLPPLALQQAFVKRLRGVERMKASHRASLAELDALFASLQDRAFRGLP